MTITKLLGQQETGRKKLRIRVRVVRVRVRSTF